MKKCLVLSIIFVTIGLTLVTTNLPAVGLTSQSIEVTVGEVERIDNDTRDVRIPDTGASWSGDKRASISAIAIPITFIIIVLALLVIRKHYRGHQ